MRAAASAAVAPPIPEVPPVTRATFPAEPMSISPFSWLPTAGLGAPRIVDHDEPAAVLLPPDDVGAGSFHRQRLPIGLRPRQRPAVEHERGVLGREHLLDLALDLRPDREESGEPLADCVESRDDLSRLRREDGLRFV